MYSVLGLGQDTTRRQINPACNACRSRKARCSNASRTGPIANPNTNKRCIRCVRRDLVCTYASSRLATPKSRKATTGPPRQLTSELEVLQDHPYVSNANSPAAQARPILPPLSELDFEILTGSGEPLDTGWDPGVHLQLFTDTAIDTLGMEAAPAPRFDIRNDPQSDGVYQQSPENHTWETYVEDRGPLNARQSHFAFHPTPAQSTGNFSRLMSQEETSADYHEQGVAKFFDDLYTIYPVLDKETVSRRLSAGDASVDGHFQALVLALPMVDSASDHRKKPSQTTETALKARIEAVEQCRSKYDFAGSPTIDTVIVSFFLFCAYNTLWRQNRAFLYLREAYDLFCIVSEMIGDTPNVNLRRRLARLELIIFNAELATYAIYGPAMAYRRHPRSIPRGAAVLQHDLTEDPREKQLNNLLIELSQIHASSATKAGNFDNDSTPFLQQMIHEHESRSMNLEHLADEVAPTGANGSAGMRRLTADVIITQHWRSLEKISDVLDHSTTTTFVSDSSKEIETRMAIGKAICSKASATLAAACSLNDGELRIVGLGKLAFAATSFRKIKLRCGDAGVDECKNVLAGLLFTIVKADYERALASTIQECFGLVLGNQPFPSPRNCLSPPRLTSSGFDDFAFDDVIENDDDPELHPGLLATFPPTREWDRA